MRTVALAYGSTPRVVSVPDDAHILEPPRRTIAPRSMAKALALPIGAARLRGRIAPGARVTIIVSDATRDEPREEMVRAVLAELDVDVRLTIAVANGTHAPGEAEKLLSAELRARARIVNHDATASDEFVDVGSTRRGTRVRYPRWLLDEDLVVATGRVRPHYFAGFGAGAKAIFPGLGVREDIRQNHLLKADPSSRLGRVDGNACRDDLEDAARLLPVPAFLLNVAVDDLGATAARGGDLVAAHRSLAEEARPLWSVPSPRADVVVVSDALPLTGTLYQASKLLPPAAQILRDGGTVVLAAECPLGTGPLDVVNQAIYALGIKPLFGAHIIYLVSGLTAATVSSTYCLHAPSVESVLERCRGKVVVIPRAGSVIPVVED